MTFDFFELTQSLLNREVELLNTKIAASPSNVKFRRALINAYRKSGDINEVVKHLNLLKKTPRGFSNYYQNLYSIILQSDNLSPTRGFTPVPYKIFKDVFDESFQKFLWAEIENKKENFITSELYSTDGGEVNKAFRNSMFIDKKSMGQLQNIFLNKVMSCYESLGTSLKEEEMRLEPNELELNVYHQGNGFRLHVDKGPEDEINTRQLTFIYYFFKKPKLFEGGDLVLFDTNRKTGVCGHNFTLINVKSNSLIFFPSDCWHQVTQIMLKSDSFLSGRFTLNGWLHY